METVERHARNGSKTYAGVYTAFHPLVVEVLCFVFDLTSTHNPKP